jgi:phosphatidylglycerophosphate synthase
MKQPGIGRTGTAHRHDDGSGAGGPQIVVDARAASSWEKVGGVPAAGRIIFHLNGLGATSAVVLIRDGQATASVRRWQGTMTLRIVPERDGANRMLPSVVRRDRDLLFIDAAHLFDPRLLARLFAAGETTLLFRDRADMDGRHIRAAFIKAPDVTPWLEGAPDGPADKAEHLFPGDVDAFQPDIRGELRPYVIPIGSKAEARKATWFLIKSQQKKVMDLPAQYLDPFFENRLTRLLAGTPVTPNMVTVLCALVAVGVAWFFWNGFFIAGAWGTFIVEVLDGVDGQLARTKLIFTKLGRHEDVIDYFYENSWYCAIAVGLGATSIDSLPALLACLMVVSDTADNIFYNASGRWHGKSIDLFSPFDAAFRRIAGRRNIYGFMFIIGFTAGYPLHTFAAAAFWSALTAFVHGLRLYAYGRSPGGRGANTAEAVR